MMYLKKLGLGQKRFLISVALASVILVFVISWCFWPAVSTLLGQTDSQETSIDNYAQGMWATYRITRFQTKGAGVTKIWASQIKIISLGADRRSKLTWLELIANAAPAGGQEGQENQKVIRFLISKDGEPLPKKLVVKTGILPPAEIDIELWSSKAQLDPAELFNGLTENLLIMPFSRLHKDETRLDSDKVVLTYNDQKNSALECDKYKVTPAAASPDRVEKRWYASQSGPDDQADIPFSGLVKLVVIEPVSSSGHEEYHRHVILTGYGPNGAKSMITKSPQLLK